MFNADFFPTPESVIDQMLQGQDVAGKTILEPSAGKGNIVDFLLLNGASSVIACEKNADLKKILSTKCKVIAEDFLTVQSSDVSHVDFIVMNPPFSADEAHILHAFNIAAPGCKIIALCNLSTVEHRYTSQRQQLGNIIETSGTFLNLGKCFEEAERKTAVEVALIKLIKPGESYKSEFEGFFTDEEPEEAGENGIMSYNAVRDLVNRYVAAVKLYDQQLELAAQMNELTHSYFFAGQPEVTMSVNRLSVPLKRNEFKKDMQKAGWKFIFEKMNLQKYATKGLRDDINKFVEQQTNIPFTMKNIYKMLEIVVGTAAQRMDRAILEAFDTITQHHADNRHFVKGWKTNSHYLVGKKFILPNCVSPAKEYGYTNSNYNYLSSYKSETISDLEKALCYTTGESYDDITTIRDHINRNEYGEWYDGSHFFKYKAFKNGNMHFEFKDEEVWGKFNQRVAKLKGYPLFEGKAQTKYQERQTGRATQKKANPAHAYKPTVLFTAKVA